MINVVLFACGWLAVLSQVTDIAQAKEAKKNLQRLTANDVTKLARFIAKDVVSQQNNDQYQCSVKEYFSSSERCESCSGLCQDGENKKMCSLLCLSKFL